MARIFILGAGTPTPTPERFGSSYVVPLGEEYLMFDCGPAATHKLVKAGLFPTQVDFLFFTHHHFDHDVDYPCFLLTRWDQGIGKENQLQVYGPTLTETITERILAEEKGAFAHDWKARINHPVSQTAHVLRGDTLPRKPPSVQVRDVGPGKVCIGKDWEVTAATAVHVQPWLDSLAYRIDSSQGSIVVTGDTIPCQSVADLAQGADVMLCMCWDHQQRMDENTLSQAMCGTLGAARMAQEAGVKKLVLVHISKEMAPHFEMEKALGDIAKEYDGQVIWAEELMEVQ